LEAKLEIERPSGRALKPYVDISKIHILFKISSSASCCQAAYFWVVIILPSTTNSIVKEKRISKKEKKHQLKSKI